MLARDPLTKEEIRQAFKEWRGLCNALVLGMTGLPEVEGAKTQREALIVILIGELTRERNRLTAARERVAELEDKSPPHRLSDEELMEIAVGEDWEGLCYG